MGSLNLRGLPVDHWVIVRLDGLTEAARWDDPVVPCWRRVRDGRERPGDVEAVRVWLGEKQPAVQLTLWEAA
jgi:hypothetical protein